MKCMCSCLNIIMQIKEIGSGYQSSEITVRTDRDPFWTNDYAVYAKLEADGITLQHDWMVGESTSGPWVLHCCLCCCEPVYATHSDASEKRVLVAKNRLETDDNAVKKKMASSLYSEAFKVVLPGDSQKSNLSLDDSSFAPEASALDELNRKMTEFMLVQTEKANERIRKFKEAEELKLECLRFKTAREKYALLRFAKSNDADNDELRNMERPGLTILQEKKSLKEEVISGDGKKQSSHGVLYFSTFQNMDDGGRQSKSYGEEDVGGGGDDVDRHDVDRHDVDTAIFDMDDDIDGVRGRSQGQTLVGRFSDSDSDSESDSTTESGVGLSSKTGIGRSASHDPILLATSLPVTIPNPQWGHNPASDAAHTSARRAGPAADADVEIPQRQLDIAANMAACIAASVTDGTEMFGELPRPRTMSMRVNPASSNDASTTVRGGQP